MATLGKSKHVIAIPGMKQARWKKWLSHLVEIHIESTSSEHNPHLYVSLVKGRYQLSTANAIYSYEDLYDNFALAFEKIDLDRLNIQNVLILGFGLGSIPLILEQLFEKSYHYTGVEIDEEVIYLFNKYALPELKSGFELITADALAFVEQANESYDMIAVDIFQDDIIPERFQQQSFLENIKKLLKPEGILLYNRLANTQEDLVKTHTFYDEVFNRVFQKSCYLEVRGNWMLLNRDDILK